MCDDVCMCIMLTAEYTRVMLRTTYQSLYDKLLIHFLFSFIITRYHMVDMLAIIAVLILICIINVVSEMDMIKGKYYDMIDASISRVYKNVYSNECRSMIDSEYELYMKHYLLEEKIPFEHYDIASECNEDNTANNIQLQSCNINDEDTDIAIMFIMLVHDDALMTSRIIKNLNDSTNLFIIHADSKTSLRSMYQLKYLLKAYHNLYIMEDQIDITWGGFSIVNATLAAIKYGSSLQLHFDYIINLSSSHYPIKSNLCIKQTLSKRRNDNGEGDKIYMRYNNRPIHPSPSLWYSYVECDQSMHRIAPLHFIDSIDIYSGSQWFLLPSYTIDWLLHSDFSRDFIEYAKHILIPDEIYFITLFKNSPYCNQIVNQNYVFAKFLDWDVSYHQMDNKEKKLKCLSVNQMHCGRSPYLLNYTHRNELTSTVNLNFFARKLSINDIQLLDEIDEAAKQCHI